MRVTWLLLSATMVALFPVLVPLMPFDTNVAPPCARSRLPCPLAIMTPVGSPVFWSLTAYYWGVGAFVAPGGPGFIGIGWLWLVLIMLALAVILLATGTRKPTMSHEPMF